MNRLKYLGVMILGGILLSTLSAFAGSNINLDQKEAVFNNQNDLVNGVKLTGSNTG